MKEYDYVFNGDKVELFQVSRKTATVLAKIKSHKVLEYQRCTDSIDNTDFDYLKSQLGLTKSYPYTLGGKIWEIMKK